MAAHKRLNSHQSPFKKILVFFLRYVGFSFFQSRLMVRLVVRHTGQEAAQETEVTREPEVVEV